MVKVDGGGYVCEKCGKYIVFGESHTCKRKKKQVYVEPDEYYDEERHPFDIDEEA